MRTHFPITVDRFRGIYYKGVVDTVGGINTTFAFNYDCPFDHAITAENVDFIGAADVQSRRRFSSRVLLTGLANVVRSWEFRLSPSTTFYLILTWDGVNGRIFKHTDLATPILGPIAGMEDFNINVMFGRCYISPHNRSFGLGNGFGYLYVWDGVAATARKAAGNPPSFIGTVTLTNGIAGSGNIEVGEHLFATVFETASGFITAPGEYTLGTFPADPNTGLGDRNVDITNIESPGGAVIVARHILATKTLFNYKGNPLEPELFFIPNATISNSTTTFINDINFYDSDLVRSADYLKDQLYEIPAGVQVGPYANRQVVVGATQTVTSGSHGVSPTGNQAWVSKPGEPESFDSTDGFLQIPDKAYGGIKNLCGLNGNLYLFRDSATSSSRDNGDSPSTWGVETVDGGLGAGCFGVASITSGVESTSDVAVVLSRNGLFLFNGSYASTAISWKLSGYFDALQDYAAELPDFYKYQVTVVPGLKLIFVSGLINTDGTGDPQRRLMVCDYSRGFGFEDVDWRFYSILKTSGVLGSTVVSIFSELAYDSATLDTGNRSSIAVLINDVGAGTPFRIMRHLSNSTSDSKDIGLAATAWNYRLGYTPPDEESNLQHFTSVRYYDTGVSAGGTDISISGTFIGFVSGGETLNLYTGPPSNIPDFRSKTLGPFNKRAERMSIQFSNVNYQGLWRLSRLIIFGKTDTRDIPK